MNELEQARKDFIKSGIKYHQAWDEYKQVRDFYYQHKNNWIQGSNSLDPIEDDEYYRALDKYDQARNNYNQDWDKWFQVRNTLLKLEIANILATKISI